MKNNEDNIMMRVRSRFPEGSTEFKPGSDRDWIFNVYGKTPEADPFGESFPRDTTLPELEVEPEPAAAPAEPEPKDTLAYKMKHPQKATVMPKVWTAMKPGEGGDDLGERQPINW
jgi:hypothetical protein